MVHGVSEPAPESFLVGTQGSVPEVGREISDRIPSLALNTCSILFSQEILRELRDFCLHTSHHSLFCLGSPFGNQASFPLVPATQKRRFLQGE